MGETAKPKPSAGAAEGGAALGSLAPPPEIKPSVNLGADAGKAEATLLAAAATRTAAARIAAAIKPCVAGRSLVLLPGPEAAAFANYLPFALQQKALLASFERAAADARALESQANPPSAQRESVSAPALAAASLALQGLAELGGYFASVYSFENDTLAPDVAQLSAALGRELSQAGAAGVFAPGSALPTVEAMDSALAPLSEAAGAAVVEADRLDRAARGKPDTGEGKAAADLLARAAARHREPLAKAEAYFSALAGADEKTGPSLIRILREKAVYDAVRQESALALCFELRATVGGHYTRSSLWSFLWNTAPFFAMGGVVASYVLSDRAGRILASGLVPASSGYERVQYVCDRLSR